MVLLAETTKDGWRPGIGDPTFMGWFTVFAYAVAAVLCWRAYRAAKPSHHQLHRRAARFWLLLTALFAVLAVNKQLDLQSWFTSVGRELADRGGWYEQRRIVQFTAVAVLAVIGCFAIGWLLWLTRKGWREYGLAVAGATFIVFFVVIRAASFHHFDEILGATLLGLRMNWVFELGGIACVAVSAYMNRRPRIAIDRAASTVEEHSRRTRRLNDSESRDSFRWMVERMRQK